MMHIGTVIKLERIKRDMKLEALAKGVCSVAHLSRIENGQTNPRKEIQQKLFKRLEINIDNPTSQINTDLQEKIDEIYRDCVSVINSRDHQGASNIVSQLSKLLKSNGLNAKVTIDLNLLLFRMLLLQKENVNRIFEQMKKIQHANLILNPLQEFRVYMITGIAAYGCGQIKYCLNEFTKGAKLMEEIPLSQFERADFLYMQSIVQTATNRSVEALKNVKYSLEYFRSKLAYRRVIECLIVCGTVYKQLNQINQSLEKLHEAERIAIEFQLKNFLGIVYQNIGSAYSIKGDPNRAIMYFKNSLEYKKKPAESIYTVFSLVKETKKLGNAKELAHWVQIGERMIPKLQEPSRTLFQIHFNVYQALQSKDELQIEIQLLVAYDFFKQSSKISQWKEYGKMLANFYERNGQYKKAVQYYKEIVE